jgi:hypothetical protein
MEKFLALEKDLCLNYIYLASVIRNFDVPYWKNEFHLEWN